jgi:hypothetical protein
LSILGSPGASQLLPSPFHQRGFCLSLFPSWQNLHQGRVFIAQHFSG